MTRRARLVAAATVVVLAVSGSAWATMHLTQSDAPPTLTVADRAPLRRETIEGERWLVHPTVHFRVRDPGPTFLPQPTASAPGTPATWLYRDDASGLALSILLEVPPRNTHSAFNSYVDGARRGMREQGAVIDAVHANFFAARGECEIDAHVGDEHIIAVTHIFETGRVARIYRVGVSGPAELRDIVTSFAPP